MVLGLVTFSWFPVCNDTQVRALVPSAFVSLAVHSSDTVVSSYYISISTEQNLWKANCSSAWTRNYPQFMERRCSLPISQEPATCPYTQINPGHVLRTKILNAHFNIILSSHLFLDLPVGLFPFYAPVLFPVTHGPAHPKHFSSTEPVQV